MPASHKARRKATVPARLFCPRPHRHRHSQPFFCRPSSTRTSSGKTFEHKPGYDSEKSVSRRLSRLWKTLFLSPVLPFSRHAARAVPHPRRLPDPRCAHKHTRCPHPRSARSSCGGRPRCSCVRCARCIQSRYRPAPVLCARRKAVGRLFPYTPLCAAKTTCPLRSFPSQPLAAPQRCVRSRPAPAG